MAEEKKLITIDNQQYNLNDLSEEAKKQLINIQTTEEFAQRLNNQRAIAQMGRQTYAQQLGGLLPEKEAPANKKKDVLTIDEKRYNVSDLSEEAAQQIANLRVVDNELQNLSNQLAIVQTARRAYGRALAEAVKEATPVQAS